MFVNTVKRPQFELFPKSNFITNTNSNEFSSPQKSKLPLYRNKPLVGITIDSKTLNDIFLFYSNLHFSVKSRSMDSIKILFVLGGAVLVLF